LPGPGYGPRVGAAGACQSQPAEDHGNQSQRQGQSASDYSVARFQVRRVPADLDAAFVSTEAAVVVAGSRHLGRSIYLTNVGVLRYACYTLTGVPADLEAAISSLTEAVEAEA
jgi:hypothetical protein